MLLNFCDGHPISDIFLEHTMKELFGIRVDIVVDSEAQVLGIDESSHFVMVMLAGVHTKGILTNCA